MDSKVSPFMAYETGYSDAKYNLPKENPFSYRKERANYIKYEQGYKSGSMTYEQLQEIVRLAEKSGAKITIPTNK